MFNQKWIIAILLFGGVLCGMAACDDPKEPPKQQCTQADNKCIDDVSRQVCTEGLLLTESCQHGCVDGECPECFDGDIRCLDDKTLGYCMYSHYIKETCQFGCVEGDCLPDPSEDVDPYDWGARNDVEWEPDIVPVCDGEYGSCLQSGMNCPTSYITLNSISDKKKCTMQSSLSQEDIDAFDLESNEHFLCIKGNVPGRYCRRVVPEAIGENSEFPILEGQICTNEQRNPSPDTLRIHIIDVGNGDSIWIQTPDDKNILIDGGEAVGLALVAGPAVIDYLDFHGFPKGSTFDGVILSHPHSDHYGGFNTIFKKGYYKLRNYIDPMEIGTKEVTNSTYQKWIQIVKDQVESSKIYMPANAHFNTGDILPEDIFGSEVTAQYLFSRDKLTKSCSVSGVSCSKRDVNSSSIFIRLTYGGRSFLFAGDAGTLDEHDTMETVKAMGDAEELLDINFLKVCHHGSNTSSSEVFLDRIWNQIPFAERGAFISSGRRDFGEVKTMRPEIVQRIKQRIPEQMFLSTNAGDDNKESDKTAFRDDNILIVVQENGDYYACYEGVN